MEFKKITKIFNEAKMISINQNNEQLEEMQKLSLIFSEELLVDLFLYNNVSLALKIGHS